MSVISLPRKAKNRTPEREALAAVLAKVADAQAGLNNAERALRACEEKYIAAGIERDRLANQVAAAKAGDVEALVTAAKAGAIDGAVTGQTEAALRALRAADDQLAVIAEARRQLKVAVTIAEQEVSSARLGLGNAASAVLAMAAGRLVEEVEADNLALLKKRWALRWLVQNNLIGATSQELGKRALNALALRLPDITSSHEEYLKPWERMGGNDWQNAFAALMRDPDAPVPNGAA
jgi:hypothetical protein